MGRYDHSRPLRSAHHCLGGKCHRGRHQRGHHHDHDHDHGQWSQVGIQYRVASLAFLYFDTEDVPGNAGILSSLTFPNSPIHNVMLSCVLCPSVIQHNSFKSLTMLIQYLCWSGYGIKSKMGILSPNSFPCSGMFDQLMALQWVKDNIEQFGRTNLTMSFSLSLSLT